MFSIKTQNGIIETLPDAALSLTFVNPAYEDGAERAFSENNVAAELALDGLPVMRGLIQVLRGKRRVRECAFKSLPTRINELLGEIKINTILPTVDWFTPVDTSAFEGFRFQPNPSITSFRLVIKGVIFERSYGSVPIHQAVAGNFVNDINAVFPAFAKLLTGAIYQVQLNNIDTYENLEIDLRDVVGFTTITSEFPSDFQEAAARTVFSTEPTQFCLPEIFDAQLYDLKNSAWQYVANKNHNGVITPNGWYDTRICEHTFLPQVKISYILGIVLGQLSTLIGETITIQADAPHGQTLSETTLFNLVTIDHFIPETRSSASNIITYKNAYSRTIDLNRHVPDVTALVLLNAFCEMFQLFPVYDSGVLTLKSKQNQLIATPLNITNDINNRIETEYKTADGFTISFPVDEADPEDYPPSITIGAGIKKIPTAAGTVGHVIGDVPYITSQKVGKSDPLSIAGKTTLRFFYYKGFQTHAGITYPFGTRKNQLPDGTIHGAAAMEWQGAQGVYAKCWAGVAEAANDSPTIKILAWLTTLQINTLKNWDACSVVFFTPDGGFRKGIIKQLQVRARVRPQTRYESEIEILEL